MRKKPTVLFLHVTPSIKKWIHEVTKKQKRRTSKSGVASLIFEAAMKDPKFTDAALKG